jgi:hypothetical protein
MAMIGVILSTAPVVQVHSYRITGRVSLKGAIPDLKRVDVAESPSRGSGWVPFLFTEVYQDSAPNQYTYLYSSHRPLFRNGDSVCVAFRRIESSPGTGRIGVAWSFNGGSTWNVRGNINYDAGLADMGGRYPNCAGFNSAGEPVVAWPELKNYGSSYYWGRNCVAVVKSSGPVGACQTLDPNYDSVWHNIAWRVSGDIYAVVGFGANGAIVGFLFDASAGSKVPGSEVILRDHLLAEEVELYDLSIKGNTLYVVGYNSAEGDGVVKIYYDGSSLVTDPVPPSAGGSSVVERHLICCWALSIGSNNFDGVGTFAYSFTIDRFGREWSVYAMKDGTVLPGNNPGHIIVHHRWDDSSLVIFAPWTGSGVDANNPVYNPRVTVDETNANKRVVSWIQYDNNPAGCGGSNFDKSIFYAATSNGGATWGINSATNPTHRVDFHFPAIDRGADYTYFGDVLTVTYLKPRDGVTDLYCNVINSSQTSSYVYVATETVSYSSGSSEDTVIVSVDERGNLSIRGEAEIYDIKGSLVAKTKGDGILNLRKGIYFIKANGRVYKVIIR